MEEKKDKNVRGEIKDEIEINTKRWKENEENK